MPGVFVKYLASKVVASAQPKDAPFKQVSDKFPATSVHGEFEDRLSSFAAQKAIVIPH